MLKSRLTVSALATLGLATPVGVLIALLRRAPSEAFGGTVMVASWVFRGAPSRLLLFFVFFGQVFSSRLTSMAKAQWQAATVPGLPLHRTMLWIILPQTLQAARQALAERHQRLNTRQAI